MKYIFPPPAHGGERQNENHIRHLRSYALHHFCIFKSKMKDVEIILPALNTLLTVAVFLVLITHSQYPASLKD